jgi:AcrR family transcriptional regulator
MYHIKDDQRSIRSSEMIYTGLVELLRKKDFAEVTVTDLVDAANVGRTTFYRNFDEIEDVLRMRCDQVVDGLLDYIQAYRQEHPVEPRTTILKPVLRYFYLHSELVELLMNAKRVYIFEESFRTHFEPFKSVFGAYFGIEEDYVDYVLAMRIGGVTRVLVHWIETGKKQAPDEVAHKLGAITGHMNALEQLL